MECHNCSQLKEQSREEIALNQKGNLNWVLGKIKNLSTYTFINLECTSFWPNGFFSRIFVFALKHFDSVWFLSFFV